MDCDDPQYPSIHILDIFNIYQPCIVSKRINQKGSLPFDDGTAQYCAPPSPALSRSFDRHLRAAEVWDMSNMWMCIDIDIDIDIYTYTYMCVCEISILICQAMGRCGMI